MKLRTTVGALLDAYSTVAPTLDRKGSSANLYLNASEKLGFLYLYSTNLISETATKIKIGLDELEASGEVLVNPSKLADGLTGLPKDTPVSLNLTPNGNQLQVQAGNVKFSLAANVAVKELGDRMRAIPSKSVPAAVIPTAELVEFAKRSIFCIPNDQTGQRAHLAALKLSTGSEKEEAFATDGEIAVYVSSAKKQSKGDGEGLGVNGLLIPAQALQPLANLASRRPKEDVSIILTEKKNKVFFKFANGTHYGALTMATVYPNLRSIIEQKTDFTFQVPRELLKQSLTRAVSFVPSTTSQKILELEFNAKEIQLKANGDDNLSDSICVVYEDEDNLPKEPVRIGMNIDRLSSIAASSQSEYLTLGFTSSDKPLTVIDHEGEDEEQIDIKYIVSGVKLNESKQ